MIKGVPASSGIAIGKAMLLSEQAPVVKEQSLSPGKIEREVARFRRAIAKAKSEVQVVRKRVEKEMDESYIKIFDAYQILLDDPLIVDKTIDFIREHQKNAEFAVKSVIDRIAVTINSIPDPYIRERAADVHDVSRRILHHLNSFTDFGLKDIPQSVILVAKNFSPSDVTQMHNNNVLGFVTDAGSKNSHTAIIARALEIPAVVGANDATVRIREGDMVIIDGYAGEVIINPDEKKIEKYNRLLKTYIQIEQDLFTLRDLPAETLDGKRVEIAANIELPIEVESIITHGANSIGLYRTEYLFLSQSNLPSEEEQLQAYKYVAERMAPNHVIIRTLDLGGEKPIPSISFREEMNPFLGWRAIRICLEYSNLFETQLRAILRASVYGKLKIMFPMITSLDEIQSALKILQKVKHELKKNNIDFDPNIEVGIMVETPGAAMVADLLAKEVDFFSVGTNDLIQFTLAVDRGNERIAHLFDPHHPAVLRLIKNIVDAGHRNDIWVGICGEMASNPMSVVLLLGMGLDELSVSPVSILEIKKFLRTISYDESRLVTNNALKLNTGQEINDYLNRHYGARLAELQLIKS